MLEDVRIWCVRARVLVWLEGKFLHKCAPLSYNNFHNFYPNSLFHLSPPSVLCLRFPAAGPPKRPRKRAVLIDGVGSGRSQLLINRFRAGGGPFGVAQRSAPLSKSRQKG